MRITDVKKSVIYWREGKPTAWGQKAIVLDYYGKYHIATWTNVYGERDHWFSVGGVPVYKPQMWAELPEIIEEEK